MTIEPGTARHLHHLLSVEQRKSRLPSVAAGIVRDGTLVWSEAIGTLDGRAEGEAADPGTQYRIGSITKTFIGVEVMRLRDEGLLRLEDPFDSHVPGSRFGHATLAQLLSHGAGVQAETSGPWWERTPGGDWDDLAGSAGQRFRAGRRFHYTNVGYGALGELVARKRGMGWSEAVRLELLEPLGMRRTTPRPEGKAAQGLAVHPFADVLLREPEHDAGAMAPAGQLWSTVEDLARWAAFLAGDTAGLLGADTLAEMLEPHTLVDLPGQPWTGAHGLGWQVWNVDGRRYAGHGGSMPGFLAGLRVELGTGDGVVVFANTTAGLTPTIGNELLAAYVEREPKPLDAWHAAGDASLLELVGTWHWGPTVATARLVAEHLVLGEPGQGRGTRFSRVGPDEWVGLDGYYTGEPLHVVRDEAGVLSHLDLASFRFTRLPYDAERDIPGGVDDLGWH